MKRNKKEIDFEHLDIVGRIGPMLTVGEAANVLHVHDNTLRRWNSKGIIRAYRINQRGDRRFSQYEVDYFFSELKSHRGNPELVTNIWRSTYQPQVGITRIEVKGIDTK